MLALCALAAGAPVTSLPGLTEPICWKHEAGYLPVKNGAKQLFYWYHEATESPETTNERTAGGSPLPPPSEAARDGAPCDELVG